MQNTWKCYRKPFRDSWLRTLKADTNLQISDTTVPCLYLRYSARTGKKVFYLTFCDSITNVRRNIKLGSYPTFGIPEIKKRAIDIRRGQERGIDIDKKEREELAKLQESEAKKIKVKDLFPVYMEKYAKEHKKPSTVESNEAQIRLYINPVLGNMYVTDLKLSILIDFYNNLAKKTSHSTASKVVWLISSFWNWCEKYEYLPLNSNPCARIDKKKNPKIQYQILNKEGYKKLFEAVEAGPKESDYHERFFQAIKLLMLTGCRYSEITELKKDEVALERKVLALEDSKTGARDVPLSDRAINLLQEILAKTGKLKTPYVFPGIRDITKPLAELRKAFDWALDRAQLPHMRIHDLRHSFVSAGTDMGENIMVIKDIAGHADVTTTEIYSHLSTDRAIETANKIADAIYQA